MELEDLVESVEATFRVGSSGFSRNYFVPNVLPEQHLPRETLILAGVFAWCKYDALFEGVGF